MDENIENKKQEVDLSLYKKHGFSDFQMEELRLGLEEGIEVSVYANPIFDGDQMYEIRTGLKKALTFLSIQIQNMIGYRWKRFVLD